jgi:hypothetical protein
VSLRAAINAFCRQCLYSPDEPGAWRQQITGCTSYKCPLYPVRPTSKAVLVHGGGEMAPKVTEAA